MGNRPLSNRLQKDRMMRKASAGVLCFVVGLWMAGSVWAGEEGAAAAPEQAAEAVVEAVAVEAAPAFDFKAKAAARINELRSKPVEDIEAALTACEKTMPKLNEEARAARLATRAMQEKMRTENSDVQAKYREIDEMRRKINEFIDGLPEVKAKLEAENAAQALLMEEVWFRTAAMGLLAEKDRAAGFPERPEAEAAAEPAADETAAPAMPEAPVAE